MVLICYGSGLYGGKIKVTNPKLYTIEMRVAYFFWNQLYLKRKKKMSTISSWGKKGSGENRNVNNIWRRWKGKNPCSWIKITATCNADSTVPEVVKCG